MQQRTRLREVDVAQAEPLADEVRCELIGLRMLEHSLDLLTKHRRIGQINPTRQRGYFFGVRVHVQVGTLSLTLRVAGVGERKQFLIRHRAPQKIREPTGQRKVVELARFFAQEQELGGKHDRREGDPHGLFKRLLPVKFRLDDAQERLDVVVGHSASKGAANELAEDAFGIGHRCFRDDFNSLRVVVDRGRRLRQVAKDAAMAFRWPRLVQRSFNLDPLNPQARSVVFFGTHFRHRLRASQSIRRDANVIASLKVVDEFRDCRLVGSSIEVTDEMILGPHQHRPGVDAIGHRFPGALKAKRRDADAIAPAIRRIELPDRDRVPR